MKGKPSRLARRRPTVDFPTPIRPTRTTGRSRRFATLVTLRGYTAAIPLGKSRSTGSFKRNVMSRLVVLIVVVLLIGGALIFLSTVPKESPTRTIEVDVPQTGPSGGNAH